MIHKTMKRHTIGDGENIIIDLEKSNGSKVYDLLTGKNYLDCSSQYASMSIGWNHPKLVAKQNHLGKVALHKIANSDFYTHELATFTEKFASICLDFEHFFFVEGGSLAVENAIKAAMDWKINDSYPWGVNENNVDILHLKQSFHGRSGYCLSLTNTLPEKTALFPKFNWSRITNPKINFPLVGNEVAKQEAISLEEAEKFLSSGNVAAIILEPIQGEGGDNHFRSEYFKALRDLADKYKAMLILDEVQTGVGLTGRMWAYEHFDIVPDMIIFGKKAQVCGFASTNRIDTFKDNVFKASSRINSTWGGNIVDMARFTIIAKIIQEENLILNAKVVGEYFLNALKTVSGIINVRGRGLMLAFDLPTVERRNEVLHNMQNKMLALACGEKSIRLRPNLIFNENNVDEAISYISEAIT